MVYNYINNCKYYQYVDGGIAYCEKFRTAVDCSQCKSKEIKIMNIYKICNHKCKFFNENICVIRNIDKDKNNICYLTDKAYGEPKEPKWRNININDAKQLLSADYIRERHGWHYGKELIAVPEYFFEVLNIVLKGDK